MTKYVYLIDEDGNKVNVTSGDLGVVDSTAHDKLDTLETSLTSLEGKLDTLETTLTNIETDAAALETLVTSTNTKLDTIDTVLDTIKVDTEAIETAVEKFNFDGSGNLEIVFG